MTATISNSVYYDPWDLDIFADPYPVFRRLREEAPLYYNERYDFYAVSRYDDVERVLVDRKTYLNGRGGVLEMIKAKVEIPNGRLTHEDPPRHTAHRGVLSRVFTPKKMNALEDQVRAFCARSLDPLVGSGHFDFIQDLGAQMPMRTISMLLGIPEQDQEAIRDYAHERIRTEPGKPKDYATEDYTGQMFAEYVDWRAKHPSDDLMTQLLRAEYVDEHGTTRRLTREEILILVSTLAGAGNDTTTRLIGWMGTVLADHPDQRRELVDNPSLIPNAIEEILRFEPPAVQLARYMAYDAEHYGQTVPLGSAIIAITASANRDDRRSPDGDRFDIHRKIASHLTFGYGAHFCLGAALARLEGRVALDEILKRFPEWQVDMAHAQMAPTTIMRGWERLPVFIP